MTQAKVTAISPFLHCDEVAQDNQLAILHLKRDILTPTLLHTLDADDEGYDEGKVTNTRFGSFPHSTLIGTPWGSQVRASAVDTGSRGRRDLKRKRDGSTDAIVKEEEDAAAGTRARGQKRAVEARTGFVHLLPPTPEKWTTSLPHRTQVVYTPDYSYVLHRIKARPGTRVIEAGAGSGSFTHAAARAVFNGHPASSTPSASLGKVFSFEFHAPRVEKLAGELTSHGLSGIVELTTRDVCNHGFILSSPSSSGDPISATAIFLDLPAPWLALKHLTRSCSSSSSSSDSPLHPGAAVHLCTFSPCIEQVQRTITTLRQLGWVEIEMVELSARRIEVRRERVGIAEQGQRGVNDSPATVDESLVRLREQESRQGVYHAATALPAASTSITSGQAGVTETLQHGQKAEPVQEQGSKMNDNRSAKNQSGQATRSPHDRLPDEERKLFKEGKLITRSEPELRTHTSYLVFAVLPRAWSEDDERMAREKWRGDVQVEEHGFGKGISRRGRKKAERQKREEKERYEEEIVG